MKTPDQGIGFRHLYFARRDVNLAFEALTKALEESRLYEAALTGGSHPEAIQSMAYLQELIHRAKQTMELAQRSFLASWQEVSRETQFSNARKAKAQADVASTEEEDDDDDEGPDGTPEIVM